MNIFEFNTNDMVRSEKEYYLPFKYEVPKAELSSIENLVFFFKNVAVLLSFTEETFANGIADYLYQTNYYKKSEVTEEQIDKTADKLVDSILGNEKLTPIKEECCDGFCDCKEDKVRYSFDE